MKNLSPESRAIIERFKIHRGRYLYLAFLLGEGSANAFHLRFKGNPGGNAAAREYERLIESMGN